MTDTVSKALKLMEGRRVLIVGDVMLDSYLYGETVRVSREAPVIVVRKDSVEHRLGGAANTAANLAALGVDTEIIGMVGRDEGGARLRTMLSDQGVDTAGLVEVSVTTPVKTRVMAGAVGTSRQQVLRIDDEPNGLPAEAAVRSVVDSLKSRAAFADAIILSDYGVGTVGSEVIAVARELVKEGHIVCVDSRHRLHLFNGMTVVTPNVPEAEEQVGSGINSESEALAAGAMLLKKLECQACLLTQGRGGMSLFQAGESPSHVDIIGGDEVTDVTGAGDTVIATFCAALAAGLGMENAMRLSNCAAGIVVGKAGAAVATPTEINDAASRVELELISWEA